MVIKEMEEFYNHPKEHKLFDLYKIIARTTMVGGPSILGKTIFESPQLSSGYYHTSDINCIKTAKTLSICVHVYNVANDYEDSPLTTLEV